MFEAANAEFTGRLPLAVSIEGEFPDAFQGGTLPPWPTAEGEDPAAEPSGQDSAAALDPQPAELVVIGCSKMFEDMVLQSGHQNALLLMNIVDSLAHGDALVSIRSKILSERSIKQVSDSTKLGYRLFAVVLVPLLLIAYGIFRAGVRRKEAALYRETLRRRR